MDERKIIADLKKGDKIAFTYIYNRYWNQVYNFSRLYLSNKNSAEEVVQEVFVKVWENHENIDENQNFKGFIFIITRNLIFNKFRKEVNEDFYKIAVIRALENSYSIDEEIDAKNLKEYIDQLIEELPPRRKLIFNLSRKENRTYKEIAELLNISKKTVENQISEALKYLRETLMLLYIFLSF